MSTRVSDEEIYKITQIYNRNFPDSPHREEYKARQYRSREDLPVNIVIKQEDRIVGLLESRAKTVDGNNVRLLQTLLVAPEYRQRGLGKRMFEKLTRHVGPDQEIVVHFRHRNKRRLEALYTRLGFTCLHEAGEYSNGETKWRMMFSE